MFQLLLRPAVAAGRADSLAMLTPGFLPRLRRRNHVPQVLSGPEAWEISSWVGHSRVL